MSRLLLKKGRDYRGHGVFVKKGEPFEVDDDKRDELLATGYFSLISVDVAKPRIQQPDNAHTTQPLAEQDNGSGEQPPAEQGETNRPDLTIAYIERLKKEELIALAEEQSINIEDCKNNMERAQRIVGALGLVDFTQLGIEE